GDRHLLTPAAITRLAASTSEIGAAQMGLVGLGLPQTRFYQPAVVAIVAITDAQGVIGTGEFLSAHAKDRELAARGLPIAGNGDTALLITIEQQTLPCHRLMAHGGAQILALGAGHKGSHIQTVAGG